jgi:hypothetical protein
VAVAAEDRWVTATGRSDVSSPLSVWSLCLLSPLVGEARAEQVRTGELGKVRTGEVRADMAHRRSDLHQTIVPSNLPNGIYVPEVKGNGSKPVRAGI